MLRQRKDWNLSQEALDQLLSTLDADRNRAGEKYLSIREKIIRFFEWRGCMRAEEYADRTIDRVAKRLSEGVQLNPAKPYLYFHGVALNLLREYWRDPERDVESAEEIEFRAPQQAEEDDSVIINCMQRCLQSVNPQNRDLVYKYHLAEGSNKQRRKDLAESLRIPLNALRIRVYRIRVQLEDCVKNCREQSMK